MPIQFRLFTVLWIATVLLASCSNDSPEIAQSEWERLIAIRGEARDLYRDQLLYRYRNVTASYTGRDSISWIDQNRQAVRLTASDGNLRLLQKIEDNFPADTEDELKVRRLRHYLLSLRVDEMTADATQYLREMRESARFFLDDRPVDLATLMGILGESRDRDRRQHAYVLWSGHLQKENAIFERIVKLQDSAAVVFGFGDFASLMQEAQELDYSLLAEQAHYILATTDSLFSSLGEQVIPRMISIKADKLRGYDMFFLGTTTQASGMILDDSVKSRIGLALWRLGLSVDSTKALSVEIVGDYGCRPETFPVLIPDDIRIALSPKVNAAEYLHELGHALHYLFTAEREFEFSQLGQGGLKEAFAFVLEDLLDEHEFAASNLALSGARLSEYREQRTFSRLLAIRSYCADFLFEQEVYAGLPELRTEFEMIKQPISGYSWTDIDRDQLFQRLDSFAAAEYLTGWFLAARIAEQLRVRFGDRWFDSPESGAYLQKLWHSGTRVSALEIAHSLGDSLIAPDALLRQLQSAAAR